MAKKLLVIINLFAIDQDVFEADGDNNLKHIASVPIDRIGEMIYSLAGAKDGIEEIEIDGNQDYIQKVGFEVLEGLEKLYSNKNVRVKLNGEVFNK